MASEQSANSTQSLKRVLTRKDLFSMGVGQVIGSGIMVMSISALEMTGRSLPFAFLISSFLVLLQAIPVILLGSVVRLRGGQYSQAALLIGEKFSGFYIISYIFSNLSISMYATGLTTYIVSLVPALAPYAKIASTLVLVAFFVLNYYGIEWLAKAQNVMFVLLVMGLLMFVGIGLPKVQWNGYFGNTLFNQNFMSNGVLGLLEASTYLTLATGGAQTIINFSAECVNPKKDIPIVIISSTLLVAGLYALIAVCIGGILPPDQVISIGNLAPIAQSIMPAPLYYFFIICGAMFALGTTLNATVGWVTKPLLQACEDGWLPSGLARLHPKYKTPYILQLIFLVVNLFPIWFGLNIATMGKMVQIITKVILIILILGIRKLPVLWPEAWEKSPFHVSDGMLNVMTVVCVLAQGIQICLSFRNLQSRIIVFNIIMFVCAFIFAQVRYRSGKVKVMPSYEFK